MKLKMEKSGTWKSCIGAISGLIEEASFEFGEVGLAMEAMDPSHVALVDFRLFAEGFEEYEIKERQELGVSLLELNKVISRARKEDELILGLNESADRLLLRFEGASTRRFTLPLIEVGEEELTQPELNFSTSAKIRAGILEDGLKNASLVSDNVTISLSDESFNVTAESDTGKAETTVSRGQGALRDLEVDDPAGARFNIDYLEDMVKSANSGDFIRVQVGKDMPIQLEVTAEGKGRLRFVLAPRVQSE